MAWKGIIVAICLLVMAHGTSISADDSAVLDSLIALALQHNPDIASAKFDAEASQFESQGSGRLPDPQVGIAAMNLPYSSLKLGETPMSGISVGITQGIPWPTKLSNRHSLAEIKAELARTGVADRQNAIVRMVTQAYYDFVYQSRALDIIEENIDLIEARVKSLETRYGNGDAGARDLLRAQTMQSRFENKKLMLSQARHSALLNLDFLTGANAALSENLPVVLLDIPDTELAKSEPSLADNPRFQMSVLKREMAGRKLSLAKADYCPDLTVGVDYIFRKDHPMDAVRGEDYLTFRLGLKMPLWDWSRKKNTARAARQSVLAAEATERSVSLDLKRRIDDTRRALSTIRDRLASYDGEIIPQARATYDAAVIAYEVGKSDFDGLLTAQLDMLDVDMERAQLAAHYYQTLAVLNELTGNGMGR